MAPSNKPPGRKITGIRGSIPPGYILGRTSQGEGDVELLSLAKLQGAGLVPTKLPGPPTGAAGGDLGGNYPDPSVIGLQGRDVASTAPTNGQVLTWVTAAAHWIGTTLLGLAPAGGTTGQVLTKTSGTDYAYDWETPSGGGGSNASSIVDDGTTLYLALTDPSGFLILNPDGSPILISEVLPTSAIPALSYDAAGAAATAQTNAEDYADSLAGNYCPAALASGDIFIGDGSNIAAAVAMSGYATISNTGVVTVNKVKGSVAGSASAAGDVGEIKTASASNITMATTVATRIAAITLTPGNWLVQGFAEAFDAGSASISFIEVSVGLVDAVINNTPGYIAVWIQTVAVAGLDITLPTSLLSFMVSVNTVIYLNGVVFHSAGTAKANGQIIAVRMP